MSWDRLNAASGYLVIALGLAAAAFERGAPPATAPPAEALAFFVRYRSELITQSLLFVLSASAYLWFFGALRTYLARAEGGTDTLPAVAHGAGTTWAGLQLLFQSGQVALALGAAPEVDPVTIGLFTDLTYAISVIAYVPLAIMLVAVAAASLRTRVFPAWVGWLSASAAGANLAMTFGLGAQSGPLVPGGPLTYVLYLLMAIWPVAVTTMMVLRPRIHHLTSIHRPKANSMPTA
ncbi:MAG: hypothetical protein K0R39_3379 [Symbiobacteriaceae bacterium]|jgi:hypothetical protein|nr:hypothetical protein [Symbiobacteriaceae bacterium]